MDTSIRRIDTPAPEPATGAGTSQGTILIKKSLFWRAYDATPSGDNPPGDADTYMINGIDIRNLDKFLLGPKNASWVELGTFNLYIRKNYRVLGGKGIDVFDIANIDKYPNNSPKGRGDFRHKLIPALIETLSGVEVPVTGRDEPVTFKGIYIENVLNERLAASLPSMGFEIHRFSDWAGLPPCFYLPFATELTK